MPELPLPQVMAAAQERLAQYGVSSEDAQITVRHLLEADWRGYPGHGIGRLLQIRDAFEKRTMQPAAELTQVRCRAAVEILDAQHGLGPPAMHRAVARATVLARMHGVGVVGVQRSGHLGILAPYVETAARMGCVAIAATTSSPAAVFAGGRRPLLGTNPLAYAWPAPNQPISADFSTSVVSRSHLISAVAAGEHIPRDWAVDANGASTDNPAAALAGGLRILDGGPKGTLISLLLSVLAGPLIGGVANHLVTGTRYTDEPPTKGDILVCFDLPTFTDPEAFGQQLEALMAVATADSSVFHRPGSLSFQRRKEHLQRPVKLSEPLMEFLLHGS